MTTQTKKAGRKSNAEKAALAAQAQELAKIEIVDGEKVVTDLEPVAKAPVTLSVDADGEDLGDVSNAPAKTPVIEAGEPVDPEAELIAVLETEIHPETVIEELTPEVKAELVEFLGVPEAFKPILVPTMVGEARTGHIPCPKAVFELVQIEGWQDLIEDQPAHIKAGLKSVLHWKKVNGTAKVRCQSSSRFADAV